MVGVSNLTKYRDEVDKNGNRVGDWAVEVDKGQTKCKFCNIVISFKKGKTNLIQHSETRKHVKSSSVTNPPQSVADMFRAQAEGEEKEKNSKDMARKLEIQIVAGLARHQISLEFVDTKMLI